MEIPQDLAMPSLALILMMILFSPLGNVTGQLIPDPIVDTQYGQVLGNRRLFEGRDCYSRSNCWPILCFGLRQGSFHLKIPYCVLQPHGTGRLYDEYLGIPFAAPPVDELRWEKPQPLEPWDDVWNATQFSIHCTQVIAAGYIFLGMGGRSGEDCLYLNIWVPGGVQANDSIPLPVMVYIYGGAFVLGTGEMYPGHALALHGEMIVVNFNYRVGTLGWLSTEDSSLPGNYGLWDLQTALEWVRDNIAAFNGDPNQVTIFGQSAGGSITSHAVISPQTNTLFNNAIAISGSSTGFFGTTTQALRQAVLIANIFNCTYNTTQDIVACLREKEALALDFWGLVGASIYERRLPNFLPVVDGEFVVRDPRESWESGEGKHINYITGSTFDDAALFTLLNPLGIPALGDENSVANSNETLWRFFMFVLGAAENPEEIAESIYSMYPELRAPDNFTRNLAASRSCTEWWFASGSHFEGKEHHRAQGSGKTFQYRFEYHQSFLIGYPDWVNGTHLDDVYSVLGWPFLEPFRRLYLDEDFDETDTRISQIIMDYYANFARTGDPNVGPFPVAVPWDEYDPARENFLRQCLNFETGNFYEDNEVDRFSYWTEVYPGLVQLPPDPDIPTSLSDFPVPTEEEIMAGVELLKELLYEMIPDEETWSIVEEMIDEFVDDRENGRL